ncbi:MAG TPA: hypothetical protein VF932_13725 [Anaerolineae bacterium]
MYTGIVEFAAVVIFLGCVWHAVGYAGRWFAPQWFIAGYLFGIMRETVMQVAFQLYYYNPRLVHFGAAPALVTLWWGADFYLAFVFARRLVSPKRTAAFLALVFVIAASLMLPVEATAAQLGWWVYEDPGLRVFGGVPLMAPLVWGGGAALYALVFQRVRSTRLPERGRMFAMITLSPILAAVHIVYTLLLSLVLG